MAADSAAAAAAAASETSAAGAPAAVVAAGRLWPPPGAAAERAEARVDGTVAGARGVRATVCRGARARPSGAGVVMDVDDAAVADDAVCARRDDERVAVDGPLVSAVRWRVLGVLATAESKVRFDMARNGACTRAGNDARANTTFRRNLKK